LDWIGKGRDEMNELKCMKKGLKVEVVVFRKGSCPTTRNYASEPTHFGSVAGVNQFEVQ